MTSRPRPLWRRPLLRVRVTVRVSVRVRDSKFLLTQLSVVEFCWAER